MKVCTKCHEEKELEEFGKDKRKKDGKNPQCKECTKAVRKLYLAKPEVKAKNNTASRVRYAKPEVKTKQKARDKARYENPEEKSKQKARSRARYATPEGRVYNKEAFKEYYEAKKQERIEYLMKNFDKLESEVDGTIYHFEINGVFKIGKTLNGFDSRYLKQVQEEATKVTEWVMNEEQMHAFEKIILDKTKDTQYIGDDVLPNTGNREIRTNDNEQLIDDLLAELKVKHIKLKR